MYYIERIITSEFTPIHYPDLHETSNHQFITIHTTRHTNDHVVLYEPNKKWLFTGDLYITSHPKVAHKSESIKQYIDSDLRSEEHTSELQSRGHLVCRLLLEKKKNNWTKRQSP